MAISKRVRFEVLKRDGFRCRYCGATPDQAELRVDHVIPAALGGSDDPSNLATACEPCNTGKTSSNLDDPIVDDIAAGAERLADALRIVIADRIAERDEALAACRHYRDHVWAGFTGPNDETLPLPDDWRDSIRRFLGLGLDMTDLEEFTHTAMAARKIPNHRVFSYFCGIAWNTIRDMQAEALERAEPED